MAKKNTKQEETQSVEATQPIDSSLVEKEVSIGKKRYVVVTDKHDLHTSYMKLMETNENVADYVGGSKIKFMLIYPNVSKKCIARVVKVNREMKLFTDADYMIQFSGQLYDEMSDLQREYVMLHELLHIREIYNFKDDTYRRVLVDHNVKDFAEVIQLAGGIDWFNDLRTKIVATSLPDEAAKIKNKDDQETVEEKMSILKEKRDKLKNSITL